VTGELGGKDQVWFVGNIDSIVDAIQEFITDARPVSWTAFSRP
jgi:hypothetical protein